MEGLTGAVISSPSRPRARRDEEDVGAPVAGAPVGASCCWRAAWTTPLPRATMRRRVDAAADQVVDDRLGAPLAQLLVPARRRRGCRCCPRRGCTCRAAICSCGTSCWLSDAPSTSPSRSLLPVSEVDGDRLGEQRRAGGGDRAARTSAARTATRLALGLPDAADDRDRRAGSTGAKRSLISACG